MLAVAIPVTDARTSHHRLDTNAERLRLLVAQRKDVDAKAHSQQWQSEYYDGGNMKSWRAGVAPANEPMSQKTIAGRVSFGLAK